MLELAPASVSSLPALRVDVAELEALHALPTAQQTATPSASSVKRAKLLFALLAVTIAIVVPLSTAAGNNHVAPGASVPSSGR
jgi:hypothetical protein